MKKAYFVRSILSTLTINKWLITSSLICAASAASSQTKYEGLQKTKTHTGTVFSETVKPSTFNGNLKSIHRPKLWSFGEAIDINPKIRRNTNPNLNGLSIANKPQELSDIQTQDKSSSVLSLSEKLNFDGQGFSGVNPPDTVGDVGKNYYIQIINSSDGSSVAVYDKTNGNLEANFNLDSLGAGNCASGRGDPIALYDAQAERWLLSEFSGSGNRLCVYVSKTDDPIAGGWYNYDFQAPSFPDYPKYGVWPDAYYIGTNENSPAVYAIDRNKMLSGQPSTLQRFTASKLGGFGFQMVIPSDLDGATLPPAGTPNYFMRHNDDESHNSGSNDGSRDFLEIFEFKADFNNASNSSFTGPIRIPIAEIDSSLCGLTSFSCITQPNSSTRLDPLREVVMFRLSYRNFGSYEVLIGNLSTDVGGDRSGLRWFELRKSGNESWSLYQEGTYAPGDVSRWMGGVAMDAQGNIALGYNVSSSSVFPSLRYSGRLASDPLGVLTQTEQTLVAGTGANSSNRYGDYSAMSVDPVDDCTFWFTGEYSVAGGQWRTRIGKFAFDSCGEPPADGFTLSGEPLNQNICVNENAEDIALTLSAVGDFSGQATLSFDGLPDGSSGSFSNNPVSVPGTSSASITGLSTGQYEFSILANAADVDSQSLALSINIDDTPGAVEALTPADGATGIPAQPTFSWTASQYAQTYTVQIDDDADFSSIDIEATISNGTNFIPENALNSLTTYYWRVTANNSCGNVTSAASSFTTSEIADESLLFKGVPKSNLDGANQSEIRFYIDVPADAMNLSFTISGGAGDADLYVRAGAEPTTSDYDCRPYRSGNNETCNFAVPQAGRYFVMIRAFTDYSGVTLVADYDEDEPSQPPVVEVISGISGANRGDVEMFELEIPTGASDLVITTEANNGDADLYVNFGSEPTYGSNGNFVCRQVSNGSNEACTIPSPQAGTYFIAVRTWNAYSNLTLTTSYQP